MPLPAIPGSAKGPQRRVTARTRERLITLVCKVLRRGFSLPAQMFKPDLLDLMGLPAGAKVVIIKPCCLGDVILATAVVEALSRSKPELKLYFAVSNWARPVVENNPHLAGIIDTGFEGSHFNFREYLKFVKKLQKAGFSAALVLDRGPLLALIPWLAGIKLRSGIDSQGRGFTLNRRKILEAADPVQHEAEIYLEVARAAGVNIAGGQTEFYPSDAARASLAVKAAQKGLDLANFFVVIHPGGGQNPDTTVLAKRWPAPYFAEIARRLVEKKIPVVLIGAGGDLSSIEIILEKVGPSAWLKNLGYQLDIGESGALFKKAGLFIGNDTGLMHLAAACGTSVVAIFGPSSPEAYGPFTPKGTSLSPLKKVYSERLPLSEYQALSIAEGGIMGVEIEQVWKAIESHF